MATRIYYVNDNGESRLVEATSAAKVMQHMCDGMLIEVADAKKVAEITAGGVKVEKAD